MKEKRYAFLAIKSFAQQRENQRIRRYKTQFSNKINHRFCQMLLEVLFQTVKHKKYEAFLKIKKYKNEYNESPLVDNNYKGNPAHVNTLMNIL